MQRPPQRFDIIQNICQAVGDRTNPLEAIRQRLSDFYQTEVTVEEKNGLKIIIGKVDVKVSLRKLVCWRAIALELQSKCTDKTLSIIANSIQRFFPNHTVIVTQDGNEDDKVLNAGDIHIQFDQDMEIIDPKLFVGQSIGDSGNDPWNQLSAQNRAIEAQSQRSAEESFTMPTSMY